MLTFRNKSSIDYVIASSDCFYFVSEFQIIETDPIFSDGHNALSWSINISHSNHPNITSKSKTHTNQKPKWKPDLASQFVSNINPNAIDQILNLMDTYPKSQQTIEHITDELQSVFHQASTSTFPENKTHFQNNHSANNKPWFGPQCFKARKKYHTAKKKL